MEKQLADDYGKLEERIAHLEEQLNWRSRLFYKAFGVSGLWGDFIEFGVFRGTTLSQAYWCAFRHFDSFRNGSWNHAFSDPVSTLSRVQSSWDAMKFIGFDSFEGIPRLSGPDADRPYFPQGSYSALESEAVETLRGTNVPLDKIILVKGFFVDTCNEKTVRDLNLQSVSVVHIDSDLYESAYTALKFCTPFFRDGSVIIFDEWLQFSGSPHYGEQRAFFEWLREHPEWQAAEVAREDSVRIAFVLTKRDAGRPLPPWQFWWS